MSADRVDSKGELESNELNATRDSNVQCMYLHQDEI